MVKEVFDLALKNKFALGAFNFANMEMLKAILNASKETDAFVIASVSEGALKYIQPDFLKNMIKTVKDRNEHKVIFHLDHGKSFEVCKQAIELGFDSVMIDASSLPFSENVALTKQVVDYAHKFGVFVEGEIGVLKGVEDEVSADEHIYTSPQEAFEFVKQTGVDSLAVAIGTLHGPHKFAGEPNLKFDLLKEIQDKIPATPLVLHGASSVYKDDVDWFNSLGGNLQDAKGVPDDILTRACTQFNVCKINTDTDLRIVFLAALKQSLQDNNADIDTRKHLTAAQKAVEKTVKHKIKVFGQ